MENLLFQTSLIAAFVAGMVALFAPCCITFLLPAYLGSVFKEKEKVLLATVVFGLGIFVVLFPAVMGIAFLGKFLFRYHDQMYFLAGSFMLIIAVISFFGLKLPMPNISRNVSGKTDIASVFVLGIFSGLTSACCAPVLMGILTFAFLSPSFLGAILIGVMYVLGMVAPLLIISVFLSGKMPKFLNLRKALFKINFLGKDYVIILNNFIAAIIFFTAGIATISLTMTGRLSMEKTGEVTKIIQNAGGLIDSLVGKNIPLNIFFLGKKEQII